MSHVPKTAIRNQVRASRAHPGPWGPSPITSALARQRLAPDASKLEVASTAMEISGCLTATARDSRFDAWPLAPTAATCLTAPERPAK